MRIFTGIWWSLLALSGPAFTVHAQEQPPLETLTIFGERDDLHRVVGSAHRVDAGALATYGYDDIHRVLGLVPGVYLREEDGFGLRPNIGLRGGSSDRSQKVTLLEDGVPISPAPYSAPAAYFFPLTARMVGVEVFKGPSSIQFGPQTVGGAINLVSAPIPRTPSAMFDVAAGDDAYRRVHARGGSTWQDFGLSGEYVHVASDGFKALDGGGDTGFEKNEWVLKGGYRLRTGTLEARLSYADEVSEETYLGLTDADFRANPVRRYRASALDRMEWEWVGARVSWAQAAFGGDLQLSGYGHHFERAWNKFNNFRRADVRDVLANPERPLNRVFYETLTGGRNSDPNTDADDLLIGTNARRFGMVGLQASQQWDIGAGADGRFTHLLEIGARLHEDRIRRLHDEYAFEMISEQLLRKDSTLAITSDNTASTEAAALWVRDEIAFDRWTVVPGVRFESISSTFDDRLAGVRRYNEYAEMLAGIGVSYAQSENFTVMAGVHKGFSPATPSRGAAPEPERAVNWEGGLRWSGQYGRIESVLFYSDYSNLTAECTFSAGCGSADLGRHINAGEAQIAGLEASWNHQLALSQGLLVPIIVSHTVTETEILSSFTSVNPQFGQVEPGYELPYVPRLRSNVRVGLTHSRWGVHLSLSYESRMRDEAGEGPIPETEGTDEYAVLDVAGHYQLSSRLRFAGRIDNVTDEVYVAARRPFGARPGRPRAAQLGLTFRY